MNIQELRDKPISKQQQGDVIIRRVDVSVKGMELVDLKPGESIVLSNNPHAIKGGRLYKHESGALFVEFKKAGSFNHTQHGVNPVSPGVYFVEPKIEVDFLSDMFEFSQSF